MNQNSDAPADLSGLEMDLAKSFQPSWVKESSSPDKNARLAAQSQEFEREDRSHRSSDNWKARGDRDQRRPARPQRREDDRGAKARPTGERRPTDNRNQGQRRDNRPERQGDPRRDRAPEPREALLEGWEIKFIPEPRGIEGLAKQIKSTAKAFGIFELARLVLEKSPRYLVEFHRKSGPNLFRCTADETLWLSERDAVAHILSSQFDKFYTRERVAVEAPKGVFPFIAQCGMSDVLIGPPNHHDYQLKVRKLHSERFSNVPFDIYKARIKMVRDEESIQKWKDEQSFQDVFHPVETPEGTEPLTLKNQAEAELHFLQNHASTAVVAAGDKFTVPGSAAVNDSAPLILIFVRHELDNLIRFPLPLAHVIGQELGARGLQIFKGGDNVTFISIARPRALDRQATPVSETLAAILDYLESNPRVPRAEQWKALLALPQLGPDADAAAREQTLLKELFWLLHQGHVIDYASKGLEIARKAPAREKPAPPAATSEADKTLG